MQIGRTAAGSDVDGIIGAARSEGSRIISEPSGPDRFWLRSKAIERASSAERGSLSPAATRTEIALSASPARDSHHQPAPASSSTPAATSIASHGMARPGRGGGTACRPSPATAATNGANALPPRAPERSIAWYWRKPSGGSTRSISTGTRRPLSRPAAASSSTQADFTEVFDHSTTTRSAAAKASSILVPKRDPAPICWSHHTSWPAACRAAAMRPALGASSRA